MSKIFTVTFPDIGEGVVEGEVIEWLKQVGETLVQDEPVVIVMTDKATVELPAPHPGKLARQYFKVGEHAIRDKPLYDIEIEEKTETTIPEKKKPLASPAVRKMAKDKDIDLNQVTGTGPEGHITKEDLEKKTPAITGDQEKPLVGIQNLMAKKMSESHAHIPAFSYFEQLDATRLVQLRAAFKTEAAKENINVTFMPFIIKALSLSLSQFPLINSSLNIERNSIISHQHHNVGIAITTKQGLVVPVLKNVEKLSLQEIIYAFEHLKEKTLNNKLDPNDMKEGTITISNFGVLGGGGMWATPVINYPEVAILAIARIQKQPIVRNNSVVVRDVLNLSWSFDHRIIDGDLAASFSHYMCMLLQNPAPLM